MKTNLRWFAGMGMGEWEREREREVGSERVMPL
jgi:hypothetical protein